ncbi:uncharacterized protein B0T15DRAFT_431602 [Chaetomium strumarium]|uniref:Jacalin-type lectin domain-containing protein n=1 Tax=Chaetomium strumarium TaxID=1170767 RepID=A0AAJ0GV64_9PEZI|nr:hypothetical protein B0T15DRAFT_431602 [Chaetomium strumarium]
MTTFSVFAALVAFALLALSRAAVASVAAAGPVFSRAASLVRTRVVVVCLSVAAVFPPAALAAQWSPDLCVPPKGVGSSSGGRPFTILGEEGATVSMLRVYRNNGRVGYLRGLVVGFSDGLEVRAGVRKDQFLDLVFAEGETITGATLWKVGNSSSVRVARLDITTTLRSWGFGVDNTASLSATAVDVGSGVLVGFQGRAGDDLDQIAPIFLKRMSSSYVDDIVFEDFGRQDGLQLVTLREGSAIWNGSDYSWTFSGSQGVERETSFVLGTSMSLNIGTTFKATVPFLESGILVGWTGGTTQSWGETVKRTESLGWSTTIALSESNPGVFCTARVWEGRLNVRWTGRQTIIAEGRTSTTAVHGMMKTVAYGKVETVCRPLAVPAPLSAKVGKRFVA